MKSRFGIIGTIMLLFTVTFTGCTDLDELTQFSIVSFEIQPQIIHNGESANLSWVVTGAQTAYIDHGVGNVSNIGKRIVFPTENTTYMLTASNETKTRKATVQIIVLQNFETETDNNIVPTVQMLADEVDDRLSVINTDSDVYWDELAIRVTGNVKICINGEVTGSKGYNLTADTYYKISDYMMVSGSAHVLVHGSDFIDLEGTSASLSDVTVTLIHDVTDTTLGTYTYSSIIWRDWETVIEPTIQMMVDEDDDRLSVINTDSDVYWDELAIRATEFVIININGEVENKKGAGLFPDTYYNISDGMMSGGNAHVLVRGSDFIDIESIENLTHVTITIIHDDTDTTLGTFTFSSIMSVYDKDWVPTVQMLADEDDDRLSVIHVFPDAYWDELAIRVTGDVSICINGEATGSRRYNLTADTYYKVSDYMMVSGSAHVLVHGSDFIDIEGTSASLSDVTVTLIHDVTDTTLGTYTYSSIAQLT